MSSTLVSKRSSRVNVGTVINVNNVMKDVTTDHEFTDFIAKNYIQLCEEAGKFGIDREYSVDLINDVWKSYKMDEQDGNGYDMCKGNRDGIISIEQAIYGRIKGYSKNPRYRRVNEAPHFNKDTNKYEIKEIACSYNTDDLEKLSGCQKMYAKMSSYDDLEEVENRLALAENIQYMLTFGDKLGLPVLSVVENIDYIKNNLQNIDNRIFNGFKEAGKEFREAFTNVVTAAMSNPELFHTELVKAKAEFEGLKSIM